MLQRLKALTLMQLQNRKFIRSLRNVKTSSAYVSIRVLLMAIITVICYFVLYFLRTFMALNVDKSLLLFIVGLMQILSIIFITVALTNELYLSKDNAILFSLPVKNNEILFSKLIVFYIKEFNKNLFFIIPLFFAFGVYFGLSILYFLNLFLIVFILPLFPILIGALMSIPYSYFKKALKRIPFLKSILIIGTSLLIWFFVVKIMNMLPTPLRLIEIYNQFIHWVYSVLNTFNSYLSFYNNLINILFATRLFIDYLIILALIAGLIFMIYFISMPIYFKIVNKLNEIEKLIIIKRTHKNNPSKNFKVFLTKEFRSMSRDADRFTEYIISIISFPFILYVLNIIFSAINTNQLGDILVIGFNLIVGLMILMSANSITSAVLSSEGGEFGILKTIPNKTQNVIWAKLLINLFVSTLAIIFGFVELHLITEISTVYLMLLSIVFLLVNSGHILWSIQLDLLNPQFALYKEKGSNPHNPNIAKSVLIGTLLSFVFGFISIYFMNMNMSTGWINLIAIAFAFLLLRIFLLTKNIKVYYKRLEL